MITNKFDFIIIANIKHKIHKVKTPEVICVSVINIEYYRQPRKTPANDNTFILIAKPQAGLGTKQLNKP